VRATERSGVIPDYVLRGLLRCGLCREAMCPGSTTKKNGKTYRFNRCSKRDKHGKEACRARPLPAGALEDFVAQRITAATADGSLAAHVDASLKARIAGKREAIEKIRADLPGGVARASVAASKYTEDLGKFEGRARELVEAKLRAETDPRVAADRHLAKTERDRLDLQVADREAERLGAALRDFARVWKLMKPETRTARSPPSVRSAVRATQRSGVSQGRLLRALVAAVRVKEATGVVEVELVNLAADAGSKEAA
jgi:site-specific DNA recombinase